MAANKASKCLKAALRYAATYGWKIFPANVKRKKSYLSKRFAPDGVNWGMTNDRERLKANFSNPAWRDVCGVGVPTGVENQIFDIENDTLKGHKVDGAASISALEARNGKLPDTLTGESPSGSTHHIYNRPKIEKVWSSASFIAPGVDVRGDGGMFVAPPSVRADGVYRWVKKLPIADAPQWLINLIVVQPSSVPKDEAAAPIDLDPYEAFGRKYARREPLDTDDLLDELQYPGNVHAMERDISASMLSRGEQADFVVSYLREQIEARISESIRWDWSAETRKIRGLIIGFFLRDPQTLEQQENKPEWLLQNKRIKQLLTEKKTEPPKLNGLFLEDLQQRPVVKRRWVVENYILMQQLNGMFGDGGVGKDYILMQLGIAATCGAQWLGLDVTQGRVLYFTAEDDLDEMRRREDRITSYYVQQNTYEPRLREFKIFSLLGKDTVLGVWDSRRGLVRTTPGFELVKREVEEFKPMLTIISNRVNSFSVNQNDDAHAVQCWRMLGSLCVDFGTTILMPGHASLRGMQSGDGMSGSVQWSNGCRLRTYLSRIKDEKEIELNPDLRVLQVMKTNYSRTGAAVSMQWGKEEGLFIADMVKAAKRKPLPGETEEQADQRVKNELEADNDRIFMRMLAKFTSMKIRVSPLPQARTNAALLFSNDADCPLKGEKGKRALREAMTRLYARGAIQSVESGYPSERKLHIEAVGLRIVKEDNP